MSRIFPTLACLCFFLPVNSQDPDALLSFKADEYYINVSAKPDSLKYISSAYIQRKLCPDAVFIDISESEVNEEPVFFATLVRRGAEPKVIEIPRPKPQSVKTSDTRREDNIDRGIIVKNTAKSEVSFCSEYKNFWAYIAPELNNVRIIYYSTSRLLNQTNIKYFKDRDGKYLFGKYTMIRLHSAASFLGDRQNLIMPRKMDVLLIGNLCYECNDPKRPGVKKEFKNAWSYLPGTKAEMDDILRQMKGQHYVIQLDSCAATELKLTALVNASRYDIVHIATHGFYFTEADKEFGVSEDSYPLERTGIVLSGANSKTATVEAFNQEGLFTALEFQNLNLSNIRLMVLSTCHSGEGDNTENTAALGVTLALLRQGINAMIVSNRAVPDKETSLFMKTFYSYVIREPNIDLSYENTIRELSQKYPATDWSFFDLVH